MTSTAIGIYVSLKIWPGIVSNKTKHNPNKRTHKKYRHDFYRHTYPYLTAFVVTRKLFVPPQLFQNIGNDC